MEAKRLAVRVTAAGVKSFVFEGKLNRKTIRWTIGKCDNWTIDDARKEARRLQGLLDKGIDPREEERQKRAEKAEKKASEEAAKKAAEAARMKAEADAKYTLKALLNTYQNHLAAQGKEKSASGVKSVVKVHLEKADKGLAEKPARDVTAYEIAGIIRRITEKGKERTAGIFRSTVKAAYACARRAPFDGTLPSAFIDFNIETNPVDPIPAIPVKARHRTLSREELKAYIQALGDDIIDQALRLALYSGGQRIAQVLRAEIQDWDPHTRTLHLVDPKGKRKEPREHLLPLAPMAASIVTDLVERSKAAQTTFLFPSATKKTPIHTSMPGPRVTEIIQTLNKAAKENGTGTTIEDFDLRDVRRTCETMLAGLGISRDIRAQLLSHGISGVQAAHYDRYEYIKEKRAALVKWERYLKSIVSDKEEKKVISFEEVAKGSRV